MKRRRARQHPVEFVLAIRMCDGEEIPDPGRRRAGQHPAELPSLVTAKVALYKIMREQGVRKAQLARGMKLHPPQIDRLLNLKHASRRVPPIIVR